MGSGQNDADKWHVELFTADEAGYRLFLNEYKPFRLRALQIIKSLHCTDFISLPKKSFGSSYTREVAFTEADWRKRWSNPLAKTFVVVPPNDGRILSSTSLIGPMPNAEPAHNPLQQDVSQTDIGAATKTTPNADTRPLHYQIAAVYTLVEVRGKGLAKATMKAAIEHALGEAQRQDRQCQISVVAFADNSSAISYEKCGFAAGATRSQYSPTRAVAHMYYYPQSGVDLI